MRAPRIVIAGASSNSGKTLVCMGLARALVRRGMKVACFKAGPDYIDSAYLSKASRAPCRNIDTWMMGEQYVKDTVASSAKDADIVLIEGVRSLYDGASPLGDEGSTAHIAKVLEAPVLLTINAKSLARGAAAVAKGFCCLDPKVNVCGVVLNMVKGPVHHIKATIAIRSLAGLDVYGSVRRDPAIATAMRHLGLVTVEENARCEEMIDAAADMMESCADIDRICELAKSAPELDVLPSDEQVQCGPETVVAVAHDAAFCFNYPDTIAALGRAGATIRYVSPIDDTSLPESAGALVLAGGFPECHAEALCSNTGFMSCVRRAADDGMPIYAECGGLLYLTRSLTGIDGKNNRMCGVFDAESMMHPVCQSVSYASIRSGKKSLLFEKGKVARTHEFHYSSVTTNSDDVRFAYDVLRGRGIDGRHDGLLVHNVLAQYSHVHFGSNPGCAEALADCARGYIHR